MSVKTDDEQFKEFLKIAPNLGLDITLHSSIGYYFQDLETQAAYILFTRAYWMGVMDSDKEKYS